MTLVWVLIAVCLLLVAAVSLYAMHLNKRLSVVEQSATEQVAALKHELSVVNNAAMGVGQRLILVKKSYVWRLKSSSRWS